MKARVAGRSTNLYTSQLTAGNQEHTASSSLAVISSTSRIAILPTALQTISNIGASRGGTGVCSICMFELLTNACCCVAGWSD